MKNQAPKKKRVNSRSLVSSKTKSRTRLKRRKNQIKSRKTYSWKRINLYSTLKKRLNRSLKTQFKSNQSMRTLSKCLKRKANSDHLKTRSRIKLIRKRKRSN